MKDFMGTELKVGDRVVSYHHLGYTFHLEDRLAKLESLLESLREEHERRLDSYQCRIELIEESLRHLAETLTDINHYLESQGGNK